MEKVLYKYKTYREFECPYCGYINRDDVEPNPHPVEIVRCQSCDNAIEILRG